MGLKETNILKLCQLEAAKYGAVLLRNNVGQCTSDAGHVIRYGLCVGSSDLIGWTKTGRFIAVEVKQGKGRVTKEQEAFLNAVRNAGGIGILAYCAEDIAMVLSNRHD